MPEKKHYVIYPNLFDSPPILFNNSISSNLSVFTLVTNLLQIYSQFCLNEKVIEENPQFQNKRLEMMLRNNFSFKTLLNALFYIDSIEIIENSTLNRKGAIYSNQDVIPIGIKTLKEEILSSVIVYIPSIESPNNSIHITVSFRFLTKNECFIIVQDNIFFCRIIQFPDHSGLQISIKMLDDLEPFVLILRNTSLTEWNIIGVLKILFPTSKDKLDYTIVYFDLLPLSLLIRIQDSNILFRLPFEFNDPLVSGRYKQNLHDLLFPLFKIPIHIYLDKIKTIREVFVHNHDAIIEITSWGDKFVLKCNYPEDVQNIFNTHFLNSKNQIDQFFLNIWIQPLSEDEINHQKALLTGNITEMNRNLPQANLPYPKSSIAEYTYLIEIFTHFLELREFTVDLLNSWEIQDFRPESQQFKWMDDLDIFAEDFLGNTHPAVIELLLQLNLHKTEGKENRELFLSCKDAFLNWLEVLIRNCKDSKNSVNHRWIIHTFSIDVSLQQAYEIISKK